MPTTTIIVESMVHGAWVPLDQRALDANSDALRLLARVRRIVRQTGNECSMISRGYRARTVR